MRQTAVLKVLAALVAFGSSTFAADPELLSMVMPDAKLLAGANAASTRVSPFGQFILAKAATFGPGSQKFTEATGFDPLQDVSEMLVASTGDVSSPHLLFLARGKFNVDKIVGALSANLPDAQVRSYGGATLLSGTNPKINEKQALAFIGNSLAVSGDLATVEAAIDRNITVHGAAQGTTTAIDPALLAQVNQLSSTDDEWLVNSVSMASLVPPKGAASSGPAAQALPILRNIQSFAGGLKFGTNVQVSGQLLATDAGSATALAAVLKLGVTFASTLAGNNAQLKDLTESLQSLQVTVNDSTVSVSLAIPENQVEAFLNEAWKAQTPALKAQVPSLRLPNGN